MVVVAQIRIAKLGIDWGSLAIYGIGDSGPTDGLERFYLW